MTRAKGYCRVDLAGGTLDIWPLGVLVPGARTVNVAIDLAVTAEVEPRESGWVVHQNGESRQADSVEALLASPDTALLGVLASYWDLPPLTATLHSESPRGGGLGASSALTLALIAALEIEFQKVPFSLRERVWQARDLEARLLRLPTGTQDYYPSLYGGVLDILQEPGGERVHSLPVDLGVLRDHLLIAYTGQSHFSAGHNWNVLRRFYEGDGDVRAACEGIAAAANQAVAALLDSDLEALGRAVADEWSHRSRLAEGISTPTIEALFTAAREAGAWGCKACGAGGGGSVAILCPADRKEAIFQSLTAQGAQVLVAGPTAETLKVERD